MAGVARLALASDSTTAATPPPCPNLPAIFSQAENISVQSMLPAIGLVAGTEAGPAPAAQASGTGGQGGSAAALCSRMTDGGRTGPWSLLKPTKSDSCFIIM